MKVVEENFRQLLQTVLCLWRRQIFVYIDEDFAINSIRPKFLVSLLMTGIIRVGVTERGSFKKYSEAVHIPLVKGCAKHETAVNILRIYRAYAEST